jgi:drug/metabolite transporter (DMT)-like permease
VSETESSQPWWQMLGIGAVLLFVAVPLLARFLISDAELHRPGRTVSVIVGGAAGVVAGALTVVALMRRRRLGRTKHGPGPRLSGGALALGGAGTGALLLNMPTIGPAVVSALVAWLAVLFFAGSFAERRLSRQASTGEQGGEP